MAKMAIMLHLLQAYPHKDAFITIQTKTDICIKNS